MDKAAWTALHQHCDHAYGICSAPDDLRFIPAALRKAQAAYERKLAREWAKANGIAVSDRGKLSAKVLAAYRAAQPE